MSAAAAKRPRANKEDKDKLIAVLSSYFNVPTKVAPYGPKLDHRCLVMHKTLVLDLKGLQHNLSFPPLLMKECLAKVAADKTGWKMSRQDIESFATEVGVRIRLMLRHISQATSKAKPPKWAAPFTSTLVASASAPSAGTSGFKDIRSFTRKVKAKTDDEPGTPDDEHAVELQSCINEDEEGEEEEDPAAKDDDLETPDEEGSDDEGKGTSVEYYVGWDPEQEAAWRLRVGSPPSMKEFTKAFESTGGKSKDAFAVARWGDGFTKDIVALTVGQLNIMQAGGRGARGTTKWVSKSGKLTVRTKADRTPLVWLRDADSIVGKGNGQICQVKIKDLKDEADAVKLMVTVAEEYEAKKIGKDDLFTRRDQLLREYTEKHAVPTCKRPAASSSSSTPTPVPASAAISSDGVAPVTPPANHGKAATAAAQPKAKATFVPDLSFHPSDLWDLDAHSDFVL
jgi:hypothetical protein